MEILVEKIFAFVFLLVGCSHLLQPHPWVDFFAWLRSKSFGGLVVVIYTLPIALVIVVFHNYWELKPSVLLTILGWIMLVKCSIYAVYPAAFAKTAEKGFSARNSIIGGIILIVISLAIAADAYLF